MHLVVVSQPLLATHSAHKQLRRTGRRVQLWLPGVDTASPANPPSAEAQPSQGRSLFHSARLRCPSDSCDCCTPTSQSTERLHQLGGSPLLISCIDSLWRCFCCCLAVIAITRHKYLKKNFTGFIIIAEIHVDVNFLKEYLLNILRRNFAAWLQA